MPQFVEQPRILDGDHGLGGEAFYQLDLLVAEGPDLLTIDDDGAHQLIVHQHRNAEHRPNAHEFDSRNRQRVALNVRVLGGEIGDMNHLLHSYDTADNGFGSRLHEQFATRLGKTCRQVMHRNRSQGVSLASHSVANLASQMRVAFSRIASNTGASSPGEELITRSTSDVAVCCSSDCRSSLSSRVFSMAMTAWAAKFFTSSICLSVNGRISCR